MPGDLTKKERNMFLGLTFCFVGHFGPPLSGTEADLIKMISLRQGKISARFDDTVTHMICTEIEFKNRRNADLKRAMKKRKCSILDVDWLECSMVEKKKRPEVAHSFRAKNAKANAVLKAEKRKSDGLRKFEAGYVNTDLYRHYRDGSNFSYDITLVRGDAGERWNATLFESIAKPRLYHFAAVFHSKKGATSMFHRPDEIPGSFECQLRAFKHFFKSKTGINWDERLTKADTNKENPFRYTPPTRGKPVGFAHDEFKPCEKPELDHELESLQAPTAKIPAAKTIIDLTGDDADNDSKLVVPEVVPDAAQMDRPAQDGLPENNTSAEHCLP